MPEWLSISNRGKKEKIFHCNGETIVISDLVMCVCPDCGQESIPLSSARLVEDILNERQQANIKMLSKLAEAEQSVKSDDDWKSMDDLRTVLER